MSVLPRSISAQRVRHTLSTLLFASGVCVAMWLARACMSRTMVFAGFVWNLVLAWIPLVLALTIRRESARNGWTARAWLLAVLWFLFFPNAFYIVTDLIHYRKFGSGGVPKWFDIQMIMAFACGGMFLGCLSLYLLHLDVRQRLGWKAGWIFAATMLALGAIGIYLGRFARLNSWDVIFRPLHLLGEVTDLAAPAEARSVVGFTSAFFLLSLAVYGFVVSMARLHEDR